MIVNALSLVYFQSLSIFVFHQVADILGKATESVPKEEVKDNNPHLKNLYEGLTMTEAQLLKVCKSFTKPHKYFASYRIKSCQFLYYASFKNL